MFKTARDSLLSLVYPQECRICGNSVERFSDGNACDECWNHVRVLSQVETTCEKCGAYLGDRVDTAITSCHQCVDHAYDRAVAAGIYEHALAATVVNLKIKPYLPQRCKTLLLKAIARTELEQDITLIIPVPLSSKRLLERGHNQAEVIGKFLADKTGLPMRTNILSRKIHTPMHRAAMDDKARYLTVNKAFEIADNTGLRSSNVLLVDDVFTSGATVSSCARILKKYGASRVDVFTLSLIHI